MAWYRWAPYVPVAERRRRARRKMEALRRKGVAIQPVEIEGRKIAHTFWGEAWCDHLESFSDFENRLPRGRTYVRNGSVCHLALAEGNIEAKVSGSEIYNLRIRIKTLPAKKWEDVKKRCAGQIGSLLELLRGDLSDHVMAVVTDRQKGLFPLPGEISFHCDCPDWAVMCKHVAAVLYGVGARLDHQPQLLFILRGVNHEELIDTDAEAAVSAATASGRSKRIADEELAGVFGIDLDTGPSRPPAAHKRGANRRATRKPAAPAETASKAVNKGPRKKKTTKKIARQEPAKKKAEKKTRRKTTKKKTAKKVTAKKVTAKKVTKKKVTKKAARKKTARRKASRE